MSNCVIEFSKYKKSTKINTKELKILYSQINKHIFKKFNIKSQMLFYFSNLDYKL